MQSVRKYQVRNFLWCFCSFYRDALGPREYGLRPRDGNTWCPRYDPAVSVDCVYTALEKDLSSKHQKYNCLNPNVPFTNKNHFIIYYSPGFYEAVCFVDSCMVRLTKDWFLFLFSLFWWSLSLNSFTLSMYAKTWKYQTNLANQEDNLGTLLNKKLNHL